MDGRVSWGPERVGPALDPFLEDGRMAPNPARYPFRHDLSVKGQDECSSCSNLDHTLQKNGPESLFQVLSTLERHWPPKPARLQFRHSLGTRPLFLCLLFYAHKATEPVVKPQLTGGGTV